MPQLPKSREGARHSRAETPERIGPCLSKVLQQMMTQNSVAMFANLATFLVRPSFDKRVFALLDLVEAVRKAVREGGGEELLANVSVEEAVQLVRAFSTYFHLANLPEQVHRSRILAQERLESGSWLSRAVDKIIFAQEHLRACP